MRQRLEHEKDYSFYKTILSHEAWRSFQKKYPNFKELGMDYWTVRRILSDLGSLIVREVLEHPMGFYLPNSFGCLRMVGVKLKKKNKYSKLDYKRTDNVVYKLVWLKHKSKVKKFKFYSFKTGKLVQRRITETIKNDGFFGWTVVPESKTMLKLDYL